MTEIREVDDGESGEEEDGVAEDEDGTAVDPALGAGRWR